MAFTIVGYWSFVWSWKVVSDLLINGISRCVMPDQTACRIGGIYDEQVNNAVMLAQQ